MIVSDDNDEFNIVVDLEVTLNHVNNEDFKYQLRMVNALMLENMQVFKQPGSSLKERTIKMDQNGSFWHWLVHLVTHFEPFGNKNIQDYEKDDCRRH